MESNTTNSPAVAPDPDHKRSARLNLHHHKTHGFSDGSNGFGCTLTGEFHDTIRILTR
jgi:hypothetical protein